MPYGGLDRKDEKIVKNLLELLQEGDDDIRRHIKNQIRLLRRVSKAPKKRVSGED